MGARGGWRIPARSNATPFCALLLGALLLDLTPLGASARAEPSGPCARSPAEADAVAGLGPRGEILLASGARATLDALRWPDEPAAERTARDWLLAHRDRPLLVVRRGEADRWGRWRIDAILEAPDLAMDLAGGLLAAGLATVDAGEGDGLCRPSLLAVEAGARARGLGLWARARPEATDGPGLRAEAGRFAVVEGTVRSVGVRASRTYLDFVRRGADGLTVTVSKRTWRRMLEHGLSAAGLTGRRVRVRGVIEIRRGPEIEIAAPHLVEVLDGVPGEVPKPGRAADGRDAGTAPRRRRDRNWALGRGSSRGSDTGSDGAGNGDGGRLARRATRRGRPALLVALGLALTGCAGEQTGTVLAPAAVTVPAEAPRTTGRQRPADGDHLKLVASFGGEYRAPAAQQLLGEVTDRLVRASERPDQTYAVTLLDSSVINAFALPTGRLYVTRGLLALASDTSEIAAVLAHEIAHVTLSHATARTELELRSQLVSRVVADVLNDPTTGAQLQSQSRFALARFSREQELEADAVGVRTLARAGYDPYGASRFLGSLNRTLALKTGAGAPGEPDMLATHPGTAERIALVTRAARRTGAPGIGIDDRARYLAAIDGIAYGDNPGEGVVRAHRFIHPSLGIAFDVPDGFSIENTRNAVLGTTGEGSRRLLFDQVEAEPDQSLDAVLKATWNEPIEPNSLETRSIGANPAATALSRGKDWTFRLAAIRVGDTTYRLIMAAKGATDPEPAFRRWTASLQPVSPAETQSLRPLRLHVASATTGDPEELARRMAVPDRALDRFLVLNGLERGAALKVGQGYKIVTE